MHDDIQFVRQELEWQRGLYEALQERYKELEAKYYKLLTLQRTAIEFKRAIEDVEGEKVNVPIVQA